MYGEVHVFVGKVLKSIDRSINRPCFFSRDRFSLLLTLFVSFFFRLYLRVGTYLLDRFVGWFG